MASEISVEPTWQPVAFKEWKLVCDVLATGEQSILLRKGGIAEGKSGFQWQHEDFFIMPTHFHEQAEQLKKDAGGKSRELISADTDRVAFSLFARTQFTGRLTKWEDVERLDVFHIWKPETIRSRFDWGDEPGISWAQVEIWKLPEPWVLKNRKQFGGCRSWIDLPGEEEGGFHDKLKSAKKVQNTIEIPDWLKESVVV